MLCTRCRSIDFSSSLIQTEDPQEYWSVPPSELPSDHTGRFLAHDHFANVAGLKASASAGCHFCMQALRALEKIGLMLDSPHAHHDGPIEIRWYPHDEKVRHGIRARELFAVAKTGLRTIRAPFELVRYEDGHRGLLLGSDVSSLASILALKAANASRMTGADEDFFLASMWLKKCLAMHALCTVTTLPDPPLPTRVLDIDAPNCASRIRLVNGANRHGPYVTLSHVWGKLRIITSTRATLDERKTSVHLGQLSRTFQDAVHATRRLSIRYLWIDSLCKAIAQTHRRSSI